MKKLEIKIKELEIEIENYKKKLKLYQELEKLFEISSNITRTISMEDYTEDFIFKSINDILKIIKNILCFQGAEIKSLYLKDSESGNFKPFSRTLFHSLKKKEIFSKDFNPYFLNKGSQELKKEFFSEIYAYILDKRCIYQLYFNKEKLKRDVDNGIINDLGIFSKIKKLFYLKEFCKNMFETLNKPQKIIEIEEKFSNFKMERYENLEIYISEKIKELKKHPNYKSAKDLLLKEKTYIKNFPKWIRRVFYPIGKFLVLELFNYNEDISSDLPLDEEKIKLAVMVSRFLEIPLTSIYLLDLIRSQNKELEKAYNDLKEAQAALIESEKMAGIGQLAAGIAHEYKNSLAVVIGDLENLTELPFKLINLYKSLENLNLTEEQKRLIENYEKKSKEKAEKTERPQSLEIIKRRTKLQREVQLPIKVLETIIRMNYTDDEVKELNKTYNSLPQEAKEPFFEYLKTCFDLSVFRKSLPGQLYKMDDIAKSLLNISRLESGTNIQEVDIKENLDKVLILLNKIITENKINIVKQYENIPKIKGYPADISIIFMNIIKNAVEAMENSEEKILTLKLSTKTEEDENYIRILISDTGHGIEQSNINRIFEPFYTTKKGKGTGLGLYNVYKNIQKHNGKINVKSQTGKGTEFEILLKYITDEKK